MASDDSVVSEFEQQRPRLVAVAQRLLGSRADAEDVVQEAWIRLARQPVGVIENHAAWLTTVVTRASIDALRSRREELGWAGTDDPPDLLVTEEDDEPGERAVLSDSVGLALLVVLESLRPDERLALVLHDLFAVPFGEIGEILGKSTDAAKMAASRARRKVRGAPNPATDRARQREVVDAFLAAARHGDLEGLLRVLHPDVHLRTYTARGVDVRQGAAQVAELARRGAGLATGARRVLVNGEPGLMVRDRAGRPRAVMACTVVDGRIVRIVSVIDPVRLAVMNLPGHVPEGPGHASEGEHG